MGSIGGGFGLSGKSRKAARCAEVGGGERESEESEEEEGVDECSSLLGADGSGRKKERRERKPRRKVKWSDRYGEKLVEVLEFEPSDSSDSDGESILDSCMCAVM